MDEKINSIVDSFRNGELKLKSGSLRFWGEWFGRPYDNYHNINNLLLFKDENFQVLEIQFGQDEVLSIWNPKGIIIDDKNFIIEDAEKLRWEWYSYGDPKIKDNRYFKEFIKGNEKLVRSSGRITKDNLITRTIDIPKEYAFEIC